MTGDRLRRVFLACGPLSALVYIGWHELAALQWEGYSRISNAISELHLTRRAIEVDCWTRGKGLSTTHWS